MPLSEVAKGIFKAVALEGTAVPENIKEAKESIAARFPENKEKQNAVNQIFEWLEILENPENKLSDDEKNCIYTEIQKLANSPAISNKAYFPGNSKTCNGILKALGTVKNQSLNNLYTVISEKVKNQKESDNRSTALSTFSGEGTPAPLTVNSYFIIKNYHVNKNINTLQSSLPAIAEPPAKAATTPDEFKDYLAIRNDADAKITSLKNMAKTMSGYRLNIHDHQTRLTLPENMKKLFDICESLDKLMVNHVGETSADRFMQRSSKLLTREDNNVLINKLKPEDAAEQLKGMLDYIDKTIAKMESTDNNNKVKLSDEEKKSLAVLKSEVINGVLGYPEVEEVEKLMDKTSEVLPNKPNSNLRQAKI